MEISRQVHGRSFHEGGGPARLDVRRSSRFGNSEPSVNYNPWNKRYSPIDPDFQPEASQFYRPSRGSHPYNRNHPVKRPQPPTSDSKNIPSLLSMEIPLQPPLFPPQDAEQMRANPRQSFRRSEPEPYNDCDDYDESPATMDEPLTEDEYLREEQKTKQQIEEIIAVAQALREKLDREEELRRQSEQSIPKLMDLKPKIPSLLEIYVPPPAPIASEDICWNCARPGHRFSQCDMPQQKRFCYRCGAPYFDVGSCPFCKTASR